MTTSRTRILSVRFAVLLAGVIATAAFVFLAWSSYLQDRNVQDKALTEARTLCQEIMAAWNYIDDVQNSINYNHDGSYDFKNVYCSVAGKSIAQRFTTQTQGYSIRFVRNDPRTGTDAPDEFEALALERFSTGEAAEHYGVTSFGGRSVFRYVNELTVQPGCLMCHGDPQGEFDITGYVKEGMALGDTAGAVSIVIPLDAYEEEASARTLQTLVFFLLLIACVILIVNIALKRWVTDALIESNEKLALENELKSNYLASISHEMRTPLASIIAFADIWESKGSRSKPIDESEVAREIKGNGTMLLDMVNNAIDVAHMDAGSFSVQLDEVEMVDLVGTVIRVIEPVAARKQIAVTSRVDEDTPIVISDWDALTKILSNLISNAVKYTPDGGRVAVYIGYDAVASCLILQVSDTGCGIDEANLDRIFDKFVQLDDGPSNVLPGSGLGLFLVKEVVATLSGTVRVESCKGAGSTFTVTVPAPTAEAAQADSDASDWRPARNEGDPL